MFGHSVYAWRSTSKRNNRFNNSNLHRTMVYYVLALLSLASLLLPASQSLPVGGKKSNMLRGYSHQNHQHPHHQPIMTLSDASSASVSVSSPSPSKLPANKLIDFHEQQPSTTSVQVPLASSQSQAEFPQGMMDTVAK